MATVATTLPAEATTAAVTKSCLSKFQECTEVLVGQDKIHMQTCLADLRLWADSVGAAAQAKSSLDHRFRHRTKDIQFIKGFLSMLDAFLDELSDVVEYKVNLRDTINKIDSIMDTLAFIGVQIRRSGRNSRLHKVDSSFDQNREKYRDLRAHLACIITAKPRETGRPQGDDGQFCNVEIFANMKFSSIQERLIEANLRRRHRFIEAQRHSQGLKDSSTSMTQEDMSQKDVAVAAVESQDNFQWTQEKKMGVGKDQTRTLPATSASGLDSRWAGFHVKRPQGSTATRITAITASARYPRAHAPLSAEHKLFSCPCCCQAIPVVELEDSQWR